MLLHTPKQIPKFAIYRSAVMSYNATVTPLWIFKLISLQIAFVYVSVVTGAPTQSLYDLVKFLFFVGAHVDQTSPVFRMKLK